MRFEQLKQQPIDEWITLIAAEEKHKRRLVVCVSGYESRSSYWAGRVLPVLKQQSGCLFRVFGFGDRKCDGSRQANDQFYAESGFTMTEFSSDEDIAIEEALISDIVAMQGSSPRSSIEVHVDYSSMPRRWYCSLFRAAHSKLRKHDSLFMWYSGGSYDGEEFPSAGVSDISLFCGQPTITPRARTHIFGLGFDRIRASAIFRVLDPESLVCFYGEPGVKHEYVRRVQADNRDLLAAARYEFSVPVNDFPVAFSKIADITREFARFGDVILVPDGPKPLVLASSLVPQFFQRRGIVSLHVRRRKEQQSPGLDVHASGCIYGFSVSGSNEDSIE
jgi:hypothetical protein